MDFEKVLPLIVKEFESHNIRYALMGGVAMAAWGIVRATVDLDYLVLSEDMAKIEKIMDKFSYRCVYKTENVSQFVSDLKIYGSIDYLHAFRKATCSMIERAVDKKVFDNKYHIKVLCPEDLIGLKLQALVNDPQRETKEYADIDAITEALSSKMDWDLIGNYFQIFNKQQEFERLRSKYGSS